MSAAGPAWTVPRPLGPRGPQLLGVGLGCAPIGNLFAGVSDDEARAAVDEAWELGIRSYDTAPQYGHGLSEQRLGVALAARPRDQIVLSTKVGRLLRRPSVAAPTVFTDVGPLAPTFDFSRDGVRRSLHESLERLGVDRVDIALVHDPDDHEADALAHAFPELLRLRDEGVVTAIGAGMNQAAMLERFVGRIDLDCVLLAGRWSLLDRSGEALLDRCGERGVGVVIGGVFNSGVLVDPDHAPTYDYAAAPPEVVARARALRAVCEDHGTTLPAAALQFAARHPAVTTVLVGARSAAEVHVDVAWASEAVPADLWPALERVG